MKKTAYVAIAATICFGATSHAATKGELNDKYTAQEVMTCAGKYLGKESSGANTDVWRMCLHAAAELARRDKIRVAEQVIYLKGYNVFEVEEKPGWFSSSGPKELSEEMITLIKKEN